MAALFACGCDSPVVQGSQASLSGCSDGRRMSPEESFTGRVPHFRSPVTDPLRALAVGDSFVVTGHDLHGAVERFDRHDGRLRWTWRAPNWVHNPPVIVRDRVLVTWGDSYVQALSDSAPVKIGTGGGGVAALDAESGRVIWQWNIGGSVMTSVVVAGDTVYAATGERNLYGLDLANGHERFRVPLGGIVAMSNPRWLGRALIIGLSVPAAILAFDVEHRRTLWRTGIDGVDAGINDVNPLFSRGLIITSGTTLLPNSNLIRPEGWSLGWRKVLGRVRHQPLPAATRQSILAIHACDGSLAWQSSAGIGTHVESNRSGSPTTDGRLIFLQSPVLASVIAYDFDGRPQWATLVPHVAKGAAIVGDGELLVARRDGSMARLDASSGRVMTEDRSIGAPILLAVPYRFGDSVVVLTERGGIGVIGTRAPR